MLSFIEHVLFWYCLIGAGFWLGMLVFDRESDKRDPKLHLLVFGLWWLVAYFEWLDQDD